MSIRYRLADWISGGELRWAQGQRLAALKSMMRMERERERELQREVAAWNRKCAALREIAAMETPRCAHIGKRMAARAREGLK